MVLPLATTASLLPMPGAYKDDESATGNEEQVETQIQTQLDSQRSGQLELLFNKNLWGFLMPCNPSGGLTRIDLYKTTPGYRFGRNKNLNTLVLPGIKISNKHCLIAWDGRQDSTSSVLVTDWSLNGTFINDKLIGTDQTRILRDGNVISFGSPALQSDPAEDYRYIFRYTAAGTEETGLYAQYDIHVLLGSGSFANVFKVMQRSTGRWFAAKFLHERVNDGKQKRDDFIRDQKQRAREIVIMQGIIHPNICRWFQTFVHSDGNIVLVMELVEGGDLLKLIRTKRQLSPFMNTTVALTHQLLTVAEGLARHLIFQICDALEYLHKLGISHRDLKPENILITADDPPVVRIGDFGLAKVAGDVTMLRTMCGTPEYLAPEVADKYRPGYTHLIDSWSVGIILYNMLTGCSAFYPARDDKRPLDDWVRHRRILWDTLTPLGLSSELHDFLRKLLQVDPAHRMSLTNALEHPWLLSYERIYSYDADHRPIRVVSQEADIGGTSQQFEDLSLTRAITGSPQRLAESLSQSDASEIRRRSDVTREAVAAKAELPQPSQEMIEEDALRQEAERERARGTKSNTSPVAAPAAASTPASASTSTSAQSLEGVTNNGNSKKRSRPLQNSQSSSSVTEGSSSSQSSAPEAKRFKGS